MVMTTIPTNGRTPKLVEQTYCWCGCGESPGNIDSDFKHGHDVKAATAAILIDFGSIKNFLEELGYGPNKRDASLTKTYHEYMASTIEAKARSRRPSWMARR